MQGSALLQQAKKLITLNDMLRDIGLDQQLSLPKVVVLGNQSSGKSSLIQQIVGLDFLPRGAGVVTRRPLELRMNNVPNLKQPYAQFDQVLINDTKTKQKFTNFIQVRQTITKITDKICQSTKNIKDIPIILSIYSNSCPNLTIIDLPGITLIPTPGQPQNIYQITKQMAYRYIRQPRSIILCVIPANQDITNSQALHMMREVDPQGLRSIGCLTKIDIMDRGVDASRILKNQQVKIKYGYVGVKNRCQYDVDHNVPVSQSLKAQKQFFATHPIYSRLPNELYSTTSLTKKLTKILYEQIKCSIPQILSQIKMKKSQLQEELRKLGPTVASTQQQLMTYAWNSISKFMIAFSNSLSGIKTNSNNNADPINFQIRNQIQNFLKQQHDNPEPAHFTQKYITNALLNYSSMSAMLNFPTADALMYLLDPLLKKLQLPTMAINNRIYQLLVQESMTLIKDNMLEKYPQFNKQFGQLVKKILGKYRKQLQDYVGLLLQAQIGYLFTNNISHICNIFQQPVYHPNQLKKDPVVYQLKQKVIKYYSQVIRNLRDVVPKQIIAILLTKSQKQIQFQSFQFSNNIDKLKLWLAETEQIKVKREQCRKNLAVLVQAEKKIKGDHDIHQENIRYSKNKRITVNKQNKQEKLHKQKVKVERQRKIDSTIQQKQEIFETQKQFTAEQKRKADLLALFGDKALSKKVKQTQRIRQDRTSTKSNLKKIQFTEEQKQLVPSIKRQKAKEEQSNRATEVFKRIFS